MKKIIIISDFDGTITKKDSLVEILDEFANPKWRNIAKLITNGRLGTRIGLRREFALCRVTRREFIGFLLKNIKIDPTFKNFLEFCEKNKLKFLVVSGGVTLNIKTIFKKFNIKNVAFYANIITFRKDRVKLKFPYRDKSCRTCSLCKAPFIRKFRRGSIYRTRCSNGRDKSRPYIIYIGDSVTDRCPARVADLVFAKHELAKYCKAKGIAYIPYDTFCQIKQKLSTVILSEAKNL